LDGLKDFIIMAKPINPYQGPAPEAMKYMGAGIMEAGANAARIMQSGSEAMGRGIAGGLKAVGDAYQQYKDDEAKFDATKKMYKAFGGSLGEEERQGIDDIFADTSMSVREKNALAPTLMQYLGASNMQSQALAKQKAELDARMAQQAAGDVEARKREMLRIQAEAEKLGGLALPSEGGFALPGAPFYDQGFAAPQQQQPNLFGSTLRKRHFGTQ
jgi:hypothetical protein